MKTITLNDREMAIVKQAVESFNDMSNDMMLENVSVNLYPKDGEEISLNKDNARVLRNELVQAFEDQVTVRTLLVKVGGRTNENGYSV